MTLAKKEEFVDKILYELDSIKQLAEVDTESISDPRLQKIVEKSQRKLERELDSSLGSIRAFVNQDEEGFFSSIGKGIAGFFKAVLKFLKKIIFFWKDEDDDKAKKLAKEIAGKTMDAETFPFDGMNELILYVKTLEEHMKFFKIGKDMDQLLYLSSVRETVDNLNVMVTKQDFTFKKTDSMVRMDGVGDSNKLVRFFKGLVGKAKPEIYLQYLGTKKRHDVFEASVLAYQVIDKQVIYIATDKHRPKNTFTLGDVDKMSNDEKKKVIDSADGSAAWLVDVTSTSKTQGLLEKMIKDTERLIKLIDNLSEDDVDKFYDVVDGLCKKYNVDDYKNLKKDSTQAYLGQMKEAVASISTIGSTLLKIKKYQGKYFDAWEKYLKEEANKKGK